MTSAPAEPRDTCARCRRPRAACWCAGLDPVETRTHVVFLQHPREAKVAIGTARMAHLALASSELHEGIDFTGHAPFETLLDTPGTVLLFPGEGARPLAAFDPPPERLVVLDGTWPQARKLFATNPRLAALPRLGFDPDRPGNYRIRREPAAHCLATIEAVVEVLARLEGRRERFDPMLRAFEQMVDFQISAAASRTGPPRHRLKAAAPWWTVTGMPDLDADWPRVVLVQGEANTHRMGSGVEGAPELIHLVAARPSTGERFEAFLAPRRPLAPGAPHHLAVPAQALLGGEPVEAALERWSRFVGPGDRLAGWGPFTLDLLAREGWTPGAPPIDLRLVAVQRFRRRPGAPQDSAGRLGLAVAAQAGSRAGHTLEVLQAIAAALRAEIVLARR